jgi:Ca2+-binding RTX toxin-like protein
MFVSIRNLRSAVALTLGLCLGNVAWSKPSIQSIAVSPNPLLTGQSFTIAVTASPDATQATAMVDFHPGKPLSLQVPLTQQGLIWTGSGVVPAELKHPDKSGAKVTVQLFDAAHHQEEEVVHVDVDVLSLSADFAGGILTITGDEHDNTLVASRDPAGTILVNGGTVAVTGGLPTIANTTLIRILGLEGNDVLLVDDGNGPMPPASLLGGEGDDTLTGSANADELDGGPGDDTLFGRDGNDSLVGGAGNDTLNGGRGLDQFFGGEGDDEMVWNPGDGSDLVEGEDGEDTLVFNGANVDENVDLSANGQRFRFFRNVGNVTMDCDGIERVVFHALGGADQVIVNSLAGTKVTAVALDLSGAAGAGDGHADTVAVRGTATNDLITLRGSTNGVDVLGLTAAVTIVGGEAGLDELVIDGLGGDDVVDAAAVEAGAIHLTLNGGAGNDTLIGGQGDDTFVWNPGDGSDVLEGQSGQDTMLFNGSNIGEVVELSANGQRLRFFRNVGSITMDCDEIELVRFNALHGADTITINDLNGTSVTNVSLDLAGAPDSGIGDNEPDAVIVTGSAGDDVVTVKGTSAGASVLGLSATVNVAGSDPALDQLIIRTLAGDDVLNASGLPAGVINLMADGGLDNDVLTGSAGDDVLLGGDGDDVLVGGPGTDALDGGPGNNVVIQ